MTKGKYRFSIASTAESFCLKAALYETVNSITIDLLRLASQIDGELNDALFFDLAAGIRQTIDRFGQPYVDAHGFEQFRGRLVQAFDLCFRQPSIRWAAY